jgi:hypothetical protein
VDDPQRDAEACESLAIVGGEDNASRIRLPSGPNATGVTQGSLAHPPGWRRPEPGPVTVLHLQSRDQAETDPVPPRPRIVAADTTFPGVPCLVVVKLTPSSLNNHRFGAEVRKSTWSRCQAADTVSATPAALPSGLTRMERPVGNPPDAPKTMPRLPATVEVSTIGDDAEVT